MDKLNPAATNTDVPDNFRAVSRDSASERGMNSHRRQIKLRIIVGPKSASVVRQ